MSKFIPTRAVVLFVLALVAAGAVSREAAAVSLIRDAEVENTIRAYATPLFESAGLNADDVRIFIIRDDSLNAFVAGGMNLFLHTGLLEKAESANQVIGVIAHETGHIAGGHLARFSGRISDASTATLVASILGALTAIATGSGEAGAAVTRGTAGITMGTLLSYSRAQESAADQAGLELLDETGQSARGIKTFLSRIADQEMLSAASQAPYVRTHPVTRDRIAHIAQHLETSPYTDAEEPEHFRRMFRRMQAKLQGFLHAPARTLDRYPPSDDSVAARYARAIAHYRDARFDRALSLIRTLIAEEPDNPYFHELKGQMLFESGRVRDALEPYGRAVELLPDEALIRVGLGQAQLETNDPALIREALANLRQATRLAPEYAFGWQQLAIAYGRNGQFGLSALALAEAALARGNRDEAVAQASRAEQKLEKGSAGWLRAQDIKRVAERQ